MTPLISRLVDQFYSSIPGAYKSHPPPSLNTLTTSYTPLINRFKPQYKSVLCWTEEVTLSLPDSFEDTKWELFEHQDTELHTASVLTYISFCITG